MLAPYLFVGMGLMLLAFMFYGGPSGGCWRCRRFWFLSAS